MLHHLSKHNEWPELWHISVHVKEKSELKKKKRKKKEKKGKEKEKTKNIADFLQLFN